MGRLVRTIAKEAVMSPGAPAAPPANPSLEDERTELLGSLTTQQQQRTSARVIKKLRLEPPVDKRETPECETPSKDLDKEAPAFPTVKQRMPKALWSADEKSLFFEALNDYGKDFDAITAYIRAKMKKKGMPDANLKTKTQVSHFYYRTWHKLSKHVHFDENVKKVAQELYALINYGELRRKLTSVNEKTCARLGEMVRGGSMAVRARGRTLRVRTPMCRALRRLNHIAEQQREKKFALHVGPRPGAEIHLPVVSPSEPLSSHKICFSSYLERMGSLRDKDGGAKMRTPKRQRKDSVSEKEVESKKIKMEDSEPSRVVHIDETAIDGIELMANYKNQQEDEEKPSTEDEKELKSEETAEEDLERDKDIMSEREKDSFSEMEDDDKFNKSDTDNESDGKVDKTGKGRKFKNLKVKFRIRPKKRGGSIFTLVMGNGEENKTEREPQKAEEEQKSDVDVETAMKQIRKGWSVHDAGDLTIGDLYLMFGSRSKLELDYWWAEPTPPLPQIQKPRRHVEAERPTADKERERKERQEKLDKVENGIEEEREKARESDTDIFSPKNTFSQDSNDGLSGDERKMDQLASAEHKPTGSVAGGGGGGALSLAAKLINRPVAPPQDSGFSRLSDRMKRLMTLAGNPLASAAGAAPRCACGHVCAHQRKQAPPCSASRPTAATEEPIFRHPTPIAPRPNTEPDGARALSLEGLPRRRRGRPRLGTRRVVVQRLLPLLPKLPPPSDLIPVKVMPNSQPALPKILPKPPPTSTSDLSFFYVLSESNGQFFFHDGDRRIPITPLPGNGADDTEQDDEELTEDEDVKEFKIDISPTEISKPATTSQCPEATTFKSSAMKSENTDIASFLPAESLSLSPSRLLREADGWLDGAVHDFSLSSFLGHLDAEERPPAHHQPAPAPAPGRPAPRPAQVESQIQSLMTETSMDYVAKFADLAAEVGGEADLAGDLGADLAADLA
ncbi:unnamed protein product, partial [Iphiclides podalirius]